jgi:hypothetical protein
LEFNTLKAPFMLKAVKKLSTIREKTLQQDMDATDNAMLKNS